MKLFAAMLVVGSLMGAGVKASEVPSIEGQVVFFYYKSVAAVAPFYETTLGLKKTFDEGWVKIYQVSATSYVGLVEGERGYHKVSAEKPAMLSIVTNDIDDWFTRIKDSKVKILRPLGSGENSPTRGFLVEDPGGYTVEFFKWQK